MKKILIGIVSILVLLVIALIVFRKPTASLNPQNGVGFPVSTSTSPTTGQNSFLNKPDTKEDQNNPGSYYLGNQPPADQSNNPPYLIGYNTETHFFNIVIYQEPIGENRKKAEQYLQQRLSLTNEQMCSLRYGVGVPDWVNSQYSDANLGFSFCPGAVQLPD